MAPDRDLHPDPPSVDDVVAALAPRFSVTAEPADQHLVVWLDTADWRLHKHGATLHLRTRRTGSELVLNGGGGCLTQVLPDDVRPPLLAEDLPEGALRDRIAPWLSIRALLALAEVQGAGRELRVLDDREKTVVRLVLESPARVVRPSPTESRPERTGTLPGRLHLEEVRGYGAQARAVTDSLHREGLAPAAAAAATDAFEAVELSPGVLPGQASAPVDPDTAARIFVARSLLGVLDEVEAVVPGTIAGLDTEFLHELRVDVRRSRSVLKLAGDTLPAGTAQRLAPSLRWIGDLTTPSRDLDVHVLEFAHDAERLAAFTASDLDPLRDHLERHRATERRALVRGLRSTRFQRFLTTWREALEAALDTPAEEGEPGAVPVRQLAAERIERADRRLVRGGRRITPDSPAESLHALRKRGKELRYTLELFGPVVESSALRGVVKELKGLQDMLGVFQDSEVQRHALGGFAEAMIAEQTARRKVPVVTLLAMGELATRLDDDQRSSRLDFEERFARFVRPRVRRQVDVLTRKGET